MTDIKLDDLDRRLIALLMDDASRTKVSLARELDVSDVTVRNRIERLVNEEIMQVVAIVDPTKIGQHIRIISGLEVELDRIREIAEAIAALEETMYVGYATGEHDIMFTAALNSEEELFHFLTETVSSIPGVRRIQTNRVLKETKLTFRYDNILRKGSSEESRVEKEEVE